MFAKLPAPDTTPLMRPPVGLTVCTLNVSEDEGLKSRDATNWQGILAATYSEGSLRQVVQRTLNVQVNAGGSAAMSDDRKGWRLIRRDGAGYAELFATGCIVASTDYVGFTAFAAQVKAVWEAFDEIRKPALRTVLSLQYFNLLRDERATAASFWGTRVRQLFLGLAGEDCFAGEARETMSITDFANITEDGMQARLRYATQPDVANEGCIAFVFDFETKYEEPTAFNCPESLAQLASMNTVSLQMFQSILTEEYRRELTQP